MRALLACYFETDQADWTGAVDGWNHAIKALFQDWNRLRSGRAGECRRAPNVIAQGDEIAIRHWSMERSFIRPAQVNFQS